MADFATTAELETFMGLGSGTLASRGPAFLAHASALIRAWCNQDIEFTGGRQESYAGDAVRVVIQLTQVPVIAVSAITINAVAFTDFTWTRWGMVWRNDGAAWKDGPILIIYDSGYSSTEDAFLMTKMVCLQSAARAIGGNPETFGMESEELRGPTPAVYLSDEEEKILDGLGPVAVG